MHSLVFLRSEVWSLNLAKAYAEAIQNNLFLRCMRHATRMR